MPRRTRTSPVQVPVEPILLDADDRGWFVYLFALSDCSAFKVGFSCNPLQRICTFSRRYFEYFDLSQSVLLRLPECELARALEATLKAQFASRRMAAPAWVPAEAGGHTEWFSAVYFGDAEARLCTASSADGDTRALKAFDHFRGELERMSEKFELWAWTQAKSVCEARSYAQRGYAVRDQSLALRDWLDAYRYFDLKLFVDEPEVIELVREGARMSVADW